MEINPTTWPSGNDLYTFLQSAGGTVKAAVEAMDLTVLQAQIDAAAETFQREVGYYPFVGTQQVRSFDPPGPDRGPVGLYAGLATMGGGRKLFLRAGLISVNSVTVGSPGKVLTLNVDYWLRPTIAPSEGEPYRHIEFRMPQYGEPNSIQVDGVWGYATTVPPTAQLAVLYRAAADTVPLLRLGLTQGVSEVQDEQSRVSFSKGSVPLAAEYDSWMAAYAKAVQRYVRITL